MDRVEQADRRFDLVALQRADQVNLDRAEFVAEGGPFGLRLLHHVFAEQAVALCQNMMNAFERLFLGNGDQADGAFGPAGGAFGGGDAGFYL